MRRGVRIAIDVGSVRIGVAQSDPDGIMSTPRTTVRRDRNGADLDELACIVQDVDALEVVVGLPRSLDGTQQAAARTARRFARALARRINPTPTRLVDERLSTSAAHRAMQEAGRSSRQRRDIVDQAAAVIILDQALELERRSGQAPGERVKLTARGV